ncbi:MAG: GNAT family N-acetyltransferase [Nonomuraea sp.]|nr:GNAT family N-acetyltransferase [Nonomuraea sp.]
MTLRAWRQGDAPAVLRAFQSPDLAEQAPLPVLTLMDAQGWIAAWEGVGRAFAVVVDGSVVGNVAVTGHEVSYWTIPAVRGRGVAVAAVRVLARWAFGMSGYDRLVVRHRTDNLASCRVALGAGFALAGVDGDIEHHLRLATTPTTDLRHP